MRISIKALTLYDAVDTKLSLTSISSKLVLS